MSDLSNFRLRPAPLTNRFTAVRPGRYALQTAVTAVTTYSGVTTLMARDYHAFSIMIPNLGPAFTAKVAWSVIDTAGADNTVAVTPSGGSWSAGVSVAVAAGGTTAGLTSETPVWTLTPIVGKKSLARIDSPTQARCLIAWRVQVPSGTQITVPNLGSYYWPLDNNAWPMMKSTSQAVAGVDTPANFTTTAVTAEGGAVNPFYVGVQYYSSKFGKQLMVCGDSIMEGLGGNARFFGAMQRSACILSTPDAPIEWFNAAQHAQTPYVYAANFAQQVSMVKPTGVFYNAYTINNIVKSATSPGLTAAIKEEDYWGLATVMSSIANLGIRPNVFLCEGLPNSVYSSSDGYGATTGSLDVTGRQAFNTELLGFGSDTSPALTTATGLTPITINRQGCTLVFGAAAAWTDPTLVNGQSVPLAASLGSDRTHPNETGYASNLEPAFRPYVEAA